MDKILDSISVTSLYYAGIYLVIGIILIPIIQKLIRRAIELRYKTTRKKNVDKKQGETVIRLLQSITKYVIWIIVIIGILNSFGVNTSALIASAGLVGVAVGFGAQSLFKDVIAGFFFIIEDQLNVGDFVKINDFSGMVEEVGLKTVKIKNWLGEVRFIPNGSIKEVTNYSLENPIAFLDVPIAYEEDIEKVIKILENLSKKIKKDIKEITGEVKVLGVQEFSDSSVNIRIIAECKMEEQFAVRRIMLKMIKQKLDEEKISIPYPQLMVHGVKNGK